MKKRILSIWILWIFPFVLGSFTKNETECIEEIPASISDSISIDSFSKSIYHQIDFKEDTLDASVFYMAMSGYAKLKKENKLSKDSILVVIDYSLSSLKKRLWVINLNQKKVVLNEWVAHGKNTGGKYATRFSNKPNSKMTSIGFMVTGEVYNGKHRESLKLNGMESRYNSNVFARGVVFHGANYVKAELAFSNVPMGRSYGCPAVRKEANSSLIYTINEGVCVFAYYPIPSYLARSKYVNYSGLVAVPPKEDKTITASNVE